MTVTNDDRQATADRWTKLIGSLRGEARRRQLDRYETRIDDWQDSAKGLSAPVAAALTEVLWDELRRRKEQLASARGRRPAPDWQAELNRHVARARHEIVILESESSGGDCAASDGLLDLVRQSLTLSVALIDDDLLELRRASNAGDSADADIQAASDVMTRARAQLANPD